MGGDHGSFPPTSWSLILGIRDSSTASRQQAMESLCRRYWKPVYCFVRRAWAKNTDDAKDLTQAFFLQLLEGHALQRYQPGKGGFRTYLKVLLRGFSADQHDALQALKRGGGARRLALDDGEHPLTEVLQDDRAEDPERLFDLAWKKQVLERAIDRTRTWFASSGRARQFEAFESYDLSEGAERPTYAAVAARLGMSESDVRNHLFSVRERLRAEIRAELSQTVSDMGQLEEEWAVLFGK